MWFARFFENLHYLNDSVLKIFGMHVLTGFGFSFETNRLERFGLKIPKIFLFGNSYLNTNTNSQNKVNLFNCKNLSQLRVIVLKFWLFACIELLEYFETILQNASNFVSAYLYSIFKKVCRDTITNSTIHIELDTYSYFFNFRSSNDVLFSQSFESTFRNTRETANSIWNSNVLFSFCMP